MQGYRPHACSGSRVRHADHRRSAITENQHQYTTKCFQWKDGIWLPLGFLGLTAAVGVWIVANLLDRLA